MEHIKADVQELLDDIARRSRGPGGAIAVIQDGEVIGQRVWGFANLEKRIPYTVETISPICSITKQFVCALLFDLERNPPANVAAKGDLRQQLNHQLKELLPKELTKNGELIDNGYFTLEHLSDMQSGMRDYWAMTTLWGAKPQDEFVIERDAPTAVALTKSFHFEPGTEFSYCNFNFHILARAIERVTGEDIGTLLEERILRPAEMTTAVFRPNTAEYPASCVGYEGTEQTGFVPSVNRIEWSGDAGIVASLNDMIAYEKYLDRCYSDPESWYRNAISEPKFKDGSPAFYRYGLMHGTIGDLATVGHNGSLGGYTQTRFHVPAKRLSVYVSVNREGDNYLDAKMEILRKILNVPTPEPPQIQPNEKWFGAFLDHTSQLSIVVEKCSRKGEISITHETSLSTLRLTTENHAENDDTTATIDGDSLTMVLRDFHRTFTAQRIPSNEALWKNTTFQGVYKCDEVESTFHCIGEAGTLYGAFDGYLGEGHAAPMRYLGGDVWVLTCPRALDFTPPGDWTVSFTRNNDNEVDGFTIGCTLARGIVFKKV